MSTKKLVLVAVGWAVVLLVGGIILLSSCSKSPSTPSTTVVSESSTPELSIEPNPPSQEIVTIDLSGNWTTKINQTVFNVNVVNSVVTITMSNNGKSMLYWYGSFSPTGTVGETITSTKLDIDKAVLSQSNSKTFSIGKNSLTFDVSAMGQTRSVEVVHV